MAANPDELYSIHHTAAGLRLVYRALARLAINTDEDERREINAQLLYMRTRFGRLLDEPTKPKQASKPRPTREARNDDGPAQSNLFDHARDPQ